MEIIMKDHFVRVKHYSDKAEIYESITGLNQK